MGPMGLPLAGLHLLCLLVLSQRSALCARSGCFFQDLPSRAWDSGSPADPALGPRDLSCYRDSSTGYRCSWRYEGHTAETRHFLRCCMDTGHCCYFEAGQNTWVQFSEQDGVSVLSNVSLWVESWVGNQTARSPRLTLQLYNWVKYDPPHDIKVTPCEGWLRMEWEAPNRAQDKTYAEIRRRTAGGSWQLSNCEPPAAAGPREPQDGSLVAPGAQCWAAQEPQGFTRLSLESCLCPLDPDAAQEIQIRHRRLASSGAVGGPWSSWSSSVCVPPGTLPTPNVTFKEEPLDLEGRRRVIIWEQPPPLKLPEGCGNPKSGAQVTHLVHVHMRSCGCQSQPARIQRLERGLNLSGGAYDLAIFSRSRLGQGPRRTWKLPARDPSGLGVLNLSAKGPGDATLQWAARAPGTKYCIEWRPLGEEGAPGHCVLTAALDGNSAGLVSHSWAVASGVLGQEQCYRVAVFASTSPRKATSWASVVSSYYFGGNASAAGTPQRVWVTSLGAEGAVVSWTASALGACPGALHRYTVRCVDNTGGLTELRVSPSETRVTLPGLRAGTVYWVQVRADSAWLPGTWSPAQRFRLEAQTTHVFIILVSLGSFLSILLLGALGYLGLSRALWHLCPPLPTPYASTAVEFPDSQGKQIWLWASPKDPEESPAETLVVTSQDEADRIDAQEAQGTTKDTRAQRHPEAQGAGLPLLRADPCQGAPDCAHLGCP